MNALEESVLQLSKDAAKNARKEKDEEARPGREKARPKHTDSQHTNGAPPRYGLRHMPFGHVTICGTVVCHF